MREAGSVSQCENVGVGKYSPTILSRFWTKVHQIWGRVGEAVAVD